MQKSIWFRDVYKCNEITYTYVYRENTKMVNRLW